MKNTLSDSLNAAIDRNERLYMKWAVKNKINYYEMIVLYILYHEGVHSQRVITEGYGIPKQTVNAAIKSLMNKGCILVSINDRDKRVKDISLTDKGISYADKIVTPTIYCENIAYEKIGREKILMVTEILNEYTDALETAFKGFDNGFLKETF